VETLAQIAAGLKMAALLGVSGTFKVASLLVSNLSSFNKTASPGWLSCFLGNRELSSVQLLNGDGFYRESAAILATKLLLLLPSTPDMTHLLKSIAQAFWT